MLRLTQLLNAVLNSHRFAKVACFGVLLSFVVWWNYGTELDRMLSGTSPAVSTAASEQADSPTVHEPPSPAERTLDRPEVSAPIDATTSVAMSLDEQMQKIDSDAMVAKIEKLATDVTKLESDLNAWNQRVTGLATSDSGRRIANDAESLLSVITLIETEPVPVDDFAVLKSRVRVLEDASLNLRWGQVPTSLDSALSTTKTLFEESRGNLDRATGALTVLEQRCQFSKPSTMTLADAIVARAEHQAAELSSQMAKAKQENELKIAKEKHEAEAMLNELALERERARVAAEKAKLQKEIEAERIAKETAAAKRQLEAEFSRDLPQIQHYLGKFFAEGYTQPQSSTHYEQRSTKGPVSLAAIQKTGALSDTVEGLDGAYPRFLHLMAAPTNDRVAPSPYPRFLGGYVPQESVATVRQGYTLLKKYQYLLVEKGYLAP